MVVPRPAHPPPPRPVPDPSPLPFAGDPRAAGDRPHVLRAHLDRPTSDRSLAERSLAERVSAGGTHGTAIPTRASSLAADGRVERRRALPAVDRALELLLLDAERGVHVPLTITTSGSVVTGTLIGSDEYFHAFVHRFTSADGTTGMDEPLADALRGVIDDAQRRTRLALDDHPTASADERAIEFLHLADARYVSGLGFLPHGRAGVLWRCRVADVSGWSLGDLMAT